MLEPKHHHDLSRPVRELMREVETSLSDRLTVGEALAALRKQRIAHKIFYIYVVDDDGRLVGVMPTRSLLVSEPYERLADLMDKSIITISASAPLMLAMEMFAMHRLLALPAVDEQNRLVGIVDIQLYSDELFDLAEQNRQLDLFQLIGVSMRLMQERSAMRGFVLRMPWLVCNIVGGIACAIIAAVFEAVLAQVLMLAMFIPLVLTLAESLAVQSLTLTLQFLHAPGPVWRQVGERLRREWRVALLMGLACGLVVGVAALGWHGGWWPASVIALSIIGSMVLAALLGVLVPAVLRAMRLDPRIAAGPVVLMFTDTATMTLYLALGAALLLD